ncbi:unnamed protein product [Arctogadus glacialis]
MNKLFECTLVPLSRVGVGHWCVLEVQSSMADLLSALNDTCSKSYSAYIAAPVVRCFQTSANAVARSPRCRATVSRSLTGFGAQSSGRSARQLTPNPVTKLRGGLNPESL